MTSTEEEEGDEDEDDNGTQSSNIQESQNILSGNSDNVS